MVASVVVGSLFIVVPIDCGGSIFWSKFCYLVLSSSFPIMLRERERERERELVA